MIKYLFNLKHSDLRGGKIRGILNSNLARFESSKGFTEGMGCRDANLRVPNIKLQFKTNKRELQ